MNDTKELKEYQVLARKYRPQNFKDLIGQDVLVKTISNAIISNRISHGYLLNGVRGIGKTTTARLIAKSLNCLNKDNNSAEPCNKCDSCISIIEDRDLDVIEMDAASKTGVNDVREIIDNIKYKPIKSKYKIFIIDEVHMLSLNAFNALLKTLEEPPPHVKFLFATTEVKKIPITIISRCQRFDLQRVENSILIEHFISISKKEGINVDNDAIALLARFAEGSVRDGLSLFDQAIANENNNISANTIIKMLGLADRSNIFDLLDEIFKGDAEQAIKIFNNLYNSGSDVLMIFDEMIKVVHFLTQIKISPKIKEEKNIPEFERIKGFEMANNISLASLGTIWQVLFKGYQELQNTSHLHQHGEMLIIRLIYLYDGPSPDELLKNFEKKLTENSVEKIEEPTKSKDDHGGKNLYNSKENTINSNTNAPNTISVKSFREFVNFFYSNREGLLHSYLYNEVKLISFKEGEVVINTNNISDPKFSRTIGRLISKWTGRIWQIIVSNSNIGQTLYEEDLINQQKQIELMKNESEIKLILDMYPNAKIHSITPIEEIVDEQTLNKNLNKKKEN